MYDLEHRVNDQYFHCIDTGVTKKFPHRLVIAVFQGIIPSICPAPSTWMAKRSKARMIAWRDRNAGEIFHFLTVNPFFSEARLSSVRWRFPKVEKEANCCCVWVWNERSENRNGIERNG
jgi:hypothetical protein